MTELFLDVINVSISAGWIVLAVLFIRFFFEEFPKWATVLLWGVVALRLVCPFSIESSLSLIPSSQTIKHQDISNAPEINSGLWIIDDAINPIVSDATITLQGDKNINLFEFIMPYLAVLWIVGVIALLIHTAISYLRLKTKIETAVILRDNIYQSENVISPFVLGLVNPKIYLPFNMTDKDMEQVIAHETAHIHRKDHWWKPLGFLLLVFHWFNPLIWLGYVIFCRDIELACDERVIKTLDRGARADYSQALLTCSVNNPKIIGCPLAFGEIGIKDRVKSVLHYQKPTFRIVMVAIITCIAVTACFLTNPIDGGISVKRKLSLKKDYEVVELSVKYPITTGGYSVCSVAEDDGEYCGDGKGSYDGSLGKYRVLIKFGDTEPSKEFKEKYPIGEAVELENSPIKIRVKRVHPQDHGFYLYAGFDSPVVVKEIENGRLNIFGGTVKIPIKVLSEN